MRKLNYNEPKIIEFLLVLDDLGFKYEKFKDSIDVIVDKISRKALSHELSRINGEYKSPPLTTQYDEATKLVSIFDQRI